MKKLIWLILLLPILLTGTKQKEQWHYELPYRAFDLNDSIPTINQFGQIRNGIIVDAIVTACNADPSGVKLTKVELDYIRALVGGMYVIGTWQKCNAIYGMVGGNAFKHKFNWKDPRDLDAAFRLTFPNGATHDANGILFNGTNQYANTFLNPTAVLANPKTSVSLSAYINGGNGTPSTATFMGAVGNNNIDVNNYITALGIRPSSNVAFFESAGEGFTGNIVVYSGAIGLNGYLLGNALSAKVNIWQKGIKLNETTQNSGGFAGNGVIFIGTASINNNLAGGSWQNIRTALATIGAGFTDKQAIQQNQIVTYAQTILGRQ
jgi:hypothetical protein